MEEKKVMDFLVRKTESVESFRARAPQNSRKEVFDSMPIKEIREDCLRNINADFTNNVEWLIQRVEAYLKISDYETVCMLLRVLCQHHGFEEQRILDVMVDSVRFGMNDSRGCAQRNIKDALVILCGKLQHEENLYNENTRKLFQEIIEKFYERSVYSSSEGNFRLISRVLYTITAVKDKYFIPILKKIGISKEDLTCLMEYVSVSKERIDFEGLRMIVLRHLNSE